MKERLRNITREKGVWIGGAVSLALVGGGLTYIFQKDEPTIESPPFSNSTLTPEPTLPKTPETTTSENERPFARIVVNNFTTDIFGIPHTLGGTFDYETYKEEPLKFRSMIVRLEEADHPLSDELRVLYDNIKAFENDVEYTYIARFNQEDGYWEFNTEPFEPKAGDHFEIFDPSYENPGIFLRNNPELIEYGVDTTFLFEGMDVKLIESETLSEDLGGGEFWKVEVIDDASPFFESEIKAKVGEVGYISEEWLGIRYDHR